MIGKYLAFALVASVLVTASDPYFGTDLSWYESPKEERGDVREIAWKSPHTVMPYLTDRENRVDDIFQVSPYYYPNVAFWFLVYTQFESSSVVLHDKNNLSLIYKVLDFSSLHASGLSCRLCSASSRPDIHRKRSLALPPREYDDRTPKGDLQDHPWTNPPLTSSHAFTQRAYPS